MNYLSFLRSNARWILGGFLLCFFSSFGQTFFISLSGGHIRSEYGLSHGDFGSLYMAATLASAITITFIGKVVDHITIAKASLLFVPLLAIACMMMSFSTSIILLALTIYLLRLFGQGMMTHISMTAMGRWYTGHRGRAVSIATLGHNGGEALFPLAMVSVVALVGWRSSWMLAAGILLFLAVPLIYALMRVERQPRMSDAPEKRVAKHDWTRAEVIRDPVFWLILVGVLAPSFIQTTIFFHQIHFLELRGWDVQTFASTFIVMAIMTTIFALICGQLVDKFGSPKVLPFFLLPLALACFILMFFSSYAGMWVFMAFMGVSYGLSSTIFGALWPEIYGTKHLGAVRALTVAAMVFSSALGPGLTGVLIDNGISFFTQIGFMGFYCLAASAIMLFVSRKLNMRLN